MDTAPLKFGAAALLAAAGFFAIGCEKKPEPGFLFVEAPGPGTYEIYRTANEAPLQFVSEQSGTFGENVALVPGSYLVLADCSSESVIIRPGERERLVVHRLEFVPPHPATANDSFSIQCSRSDKTRSRQHLSGRYALNVFHGKRDLLVGMVPMHVDFEARTDTETPLVVQHKLAAVQVADYADGRDDVSYFVSPVAELVSVTKYQRFGSWEFLLPGKYALEVNGTRMEVELEEGMQRVVKPALLRVTTSPSVDLEQPARIMGSPWLVEINAGHWLNFNETYPLLPGPATVGISDSSQLISIAPEEGQIVELVARSVTVTLGCAAADLSCLGEKDVTISRAGETFPFVESISDIPILFIDEGAPVFVGVGGSRDVAFEVPASVRDKTLNVGYAHIVPQPQHRPGQVTEFIRVDAAGAPLIGHTLDVNLEKATLMPLIVGSYNFTHFVSGASDSSDRRNLGQSFRIDAGKTVELEFPVYFTEKRYAAFKKRPDQKGG